MGWAVRLCAVSVDLDEIPNYFAIHGLAGVRRGPSARSSTTSRSIACASSPPTSRSR